MVKGLKYMIEILDNTAPAGQYIHMHTFCFASNACLFLQFKSFSPFFVQILSVRPERSRGESV